MYSLKVLLTQSPEKIKNWLLTVGGVGVIVATARGYVVDGAFVAAVGLAIERTLDMFYVAPINAAKNEAHALTAFENVRLRSQRPIQGHQEKPE